jgi:RND family efflux transporter MFP subunit
MGSRGFEPVLKGVDALYRSGPVGARTDGELIEAFLARGDAAEVAFAALVERHGPMVLRTCRGELRDGHRAEDAFQATFLILACKARSIRKAASIAGWLYEVARRVARRARLDDKKRAERERRGAAMTRESIPGDPVPEVQEEVERLPEKYRSAVVLCDLEGLSREEAAIRLGIPASTVRSRLARARQRLRGRFVRRGLAPGALALARASDAPAAVPAPLVDVTIRAATRIAAGRAAGASGPVAALVKGVLQAMFLTKLKTAALALAASATLLAAVPLVAALAGQKPEDQPAAAPDRGGPSGRKVAVATAATSDVARTTVQAGSVAPFESIDVYSRAPGILMTQAVDVGDAVKRGQVLAAMDARELMAEVDQARARLDQARAKLMQAQASVSAAQAAAKANAAQLDATKSELAAAEASQTYRTRQLERMKGLAERGAVEQRLVDETQDRADEARAAAASAKAKLATAQAGQDEVHARVQQAKADVSAAEAQVRLEEAALEKAKVLAEGANIASPIDGVVSRRNFHPGDFVRPGGQPGAVPLLTIVRADRVRVAVEVPDSVAVGLSRGALATVRVDALNGRTYEATVSRLGYTVNPATQTLRVEVDLDNPDGRLRPGQYGQVAIDLEPRRPRLVIPGLALVHVQDQQAAECFRVEGGRAVLTRIKFERIDGERVAVVDGLKPGDRVVVAPLRDLKDGEAVEVDSKP